MKYVLTSALLLTGTLSNYCHAQARVTHPAAKGTATRSETLTNKGVIALTGAGLSPELIVAKVESAACAFDLSADGLVALKKAGVTDAVLQAMLSRGSSRAGAAPSKPALASKAPKLEFANHPYLRSKATGAWSPLEKATSSMKSKMVAMGYGGVKMLYQIPNEKSPTRLAATDSAVFMLNTFGTAMPEFVLYHAKPERGTRAAVGAKVGGMSGLKSGEDVLTFNILPVGNGIFRLVPSQKLLPGEYFFAGKPVGNVMTVDAYAFGVD